MSLKGGLSCTEIRNALDSNTLHEYVDKGIITSEKYNQLLEIYGVTHHINKDKKERELSRKIKSVLSVVILFISILCGLAYLIWR